MTPLLIEVPSLYALQQQQQQRQSIGWTLVERYERRKL